MPTDAVVVGSASFLVARTARHVPNLRRVDHLASALASTSPTWVLRAGAVPISMPRMPLPSATGLPLIALGGLVHATLASVFVERPHELALLVEVEGSLELACARAERERRARVVRVPALDVTWDEQLHVIEVVTTLHRGGAERIAIDLARGLGAELVVLDHASRSTYDAAATSVANVASNRRDRIAALAALAQGADVIHAHLLDGDELHALAPCGVPIVTTFHNSRPGWPARLASLSRDDIVLALGCSRGVTDELRSLPFVTRTAWNGIAPRAVERRSSRGVALLAIANHRPQKRLERLPGIVAELRTRGHDAYLTIVGEPVRSDPDSLAIAPRIKSEAARLGVAAYVTLEPSRADVRPLLAAASAVVSPSAFEGLSLVHLEALAAGVPLVTSRVSGTEELARRHPHAHVVDEGGSFPDAILAAVNGPIGGLAPDFTTTAMLERHVDLLARAASHRVRRRDGLVLVTNNFSTGGAQSSARRLLAALSARGVPVHAIVIQEQAQFPTAGRKALLEAGIDVRVAPRAGLVDPLVTARAVVSHVDDVSPEAVLFWNVIPEHKVLIADLLLRTPVFDVSPGEMFFASLDRYFRSPRVGSPYLDARDYGALLAAAVVKFSAEKARAEAVLGVPTHVIANGVDVPAFAARSARDRIVVGTLARISPDKKLEQLVQAASPAFELRIAGGVERGSEAYAAALRERSCHVRWVGERDSASFLAECDLFAMISEPEGCPNASLEAMAAGLAVVATDAGGARDQIVHGETGLLVPRGDSGALGAAIVELAADPRRRAAMARAGHARALALFSVDRMAKDYARLCLGRDLETDILAAE